MSTCGTRGMNLYALTEYYECNCAYSPDKQNKGRICEITLKFEDLCNFETNLNYSG
jgi:hypothetical protein